MNLLAIQEMQRRIGVEPDGFWGPISQQACRNHLKALMPKPHPWPHPGAVREFFGEPGEANLVRIQFPYDMFYEGKLVTHSRCHRLVADSLRRVLIRIGAFVVRAAAGVVVDEAQDYAGIYNYRSKRGSTKLSMHAYGIAIDLDADDNTFRDTWPVQADMRLDIMEEFAREGWTSAGAFWGYDAMHFEATRPY